MKLWQLYSFCRVNPEALEKVLQSGEWDHYRKLYLGIDNHIAQQQRSILDQVLPESLVVSVLGQDNTRVFRSDGYLRARSLREDDESLSSLSVYLQYGGDTLEDVFELGLVRITSS